MPEFDSHAPGRFCWVDLTTLDLGRARRFYTAIFGWETSITDTGDGAGYLMFTQDGKLVAGLDGYTITGISQGLDDWYAANPAQSATPVIEVIWSEMVLPNLTAEEARQ